MLNKPKYKIARRLGPGIFEKTQTQKFALREGRRKESRERPRPKSDFGLQMLEKQKARYSYGIGERQFAKYVAEALAKKTTKTDELLFERLETRLDNVAYRLHLAPTRQAARQMVSHGHIMINDVRITIPSYNVKLGDKVKIREASAKKILFANLAEKLKDAMPPSWLKFDAEKRAGEVQGKPKLVKSELVFDIAAILEFYRR
ncbi:MAG: 30S ribosomal protein S4 [Parcubacteria group bacterium GW2011_GWA2_47_16]|nr:MAG: 30S ribosomal protein S4 [Parcubacteria group bacterium GW2011_GWA2_47_16]